MIDNYPVGRIVIGLFGEIAPKTVKNFVTLATSGVEGKAYAGTRFHRVMKRYLIQGITSLTLRTDHDYSIQSYLNWCSWRR